MIRFPPFACTTCWLKYCGFAALRVLKLPKHHQGTQATLRINFFVAMMSTTTLYFIEVLGRGMGKIKRVLLRSFFVLFLLTNQDNPEKEDPEVIPIKGPPT